VKITIEYNVSPYGFRGISKPIKEVITLDLGHDDVSIEYLYETFDRLALMLGFHPDSVEDMRQRGKCACTCNKSEDVSSCTSEVERTAWDGVYVNDDQ